MTLAKQWRGLLAAAALVALTGGAFAQALYYNEVQRDGRIYVFAHAERFEAFEKGGAALIGQAITRPGYGPNGETVVFDSEDAVGLYNFRHGLPGESSPKPREKPKSAFPAGKFSGLMFGDYYWYDAWHQARISSTNTASVEGQQGFWFRRLYLTYDLALSEKITTRFRLEANSNGQFAGGNLNPYVKDAYVRWAYAGKHHVTVGIQPSLTFDWFDGFWGLRHVEKTPADLYRIDSSRDFGITASGPITSVRNLTYAAQFGNDSGNGSETDKYKIVRLEGRYDSNPGIALEGFYSYGSRPNGQNRTTAQGIVGWRNKVARAGGQYLWQERRSGKQGVPDQKVSIWSGFAAWEALPKKAQIYGRFDSVKGDQGGVETGLPGADGIDYWIMSPKQPFKTVILGGEWFVHPSIRVGPNVEWVLYDGDPDPANAPGRDQDRIFRVTFFWTF